MRFVPHSYQQYAINRILEQPKTALYLDMGLGKTVCSLTAVEQLLHDRFQVTKVLVIAPKTVAESTWKQEAAKWDHTSGLKVSLVLGTLAQREKALEQDADVYVINRENTVWLMEFYRWRPPFDMLIIDESSSFKDPKSKRFRALRKVRGCFDRIVELTGTPASNGLMDLWSQIYLLDGGERLGHTLTAYRNQYFIPGQTNGYVVFNYIPKAGAREHIFGKLKDITVSMDKKDWLKLPERIDNIVYVDMGRASETVYKQLEKALVLEFPDGDVMAGSAAVLSNKLLQLANGAVYTEDREVVRVHDKKLDALKEIGEQGGNLLVFYCYQHDRDRIVKAFPKARVLETASDIEAWNAGKVPMLLAHPMSAGYGLNLQAGGNTIVWFGLTWSLEQYQQANARLYRQGQEKTVIVHHLVTRGTMDERVMAALSRKEEGQQALLDTVKAKIKEYRG
ncbi:MAG: DEAD/DEAH box helicase [Acidaminococcaceae bacterium]|nr:DEAD/DEAH box helicase [Acidaminococcaceae bacterium]